MLSQTTPNFLLFRESLWTVSSEIYQSCQKTIKNGDVKPANTPPKPTYPPRSILYFSRNDRTQLYLYQPDPSKKATGIHHATHWDMKPCSDWERDYSKRHVAIISLCTVLSKSICICIKVNICQQQLPLVSRLSNVKIWKSLCYWSVTGR